MFMLNIKLMKFSFCSNLKSVDRWQQNEVNKKLIPTRSYKGNFFEFLYLIFIAHIYIRTGSLASG